MQVSPDTRAPPAARFCGLDVPGWKSETNTRHTDGASRLNKKRPLVSWSDGTAKIPPFEAKTFSAPSRLIGRLLFSSKLRSALLTEITV
jgi:hypothetical protein